MEEIIKFLKDSKLLHATVEKYTLLVDESSKSQGTLVYIPWRNGKEIKTVIPAPFDEELFRHGNSPTYQQVLSHKHTLILK